MKTIIIFIQSEAGKEALVYPMNKYRSIEMHYALDNNVQFRKFLKEFFQHRGRLLTWVIVDYLQVNI